ncbi:hypothetical protein M430DRAFT_66516 [Amorphotheca resinae ATCC 22711]|uniref:3'-5' exonuclease domain-containing protein n=1 Tax=Amorphotheca resinae ATCC 22711 TaxID=857342 RepID=A0A2T3B1Q0_AMORE|nr:hypothetical protein M430DRAFT_66516 [Amorphotheca resinae ATCC 22711]PSS18494.1 hypothetical protein M430DRAFT_66516 [Amorphotheca resinae ATCC 22711]
MADLVDTVDAIRVFVDGLFNLPNNPPSLYIDIEGVNLLRHSSISILQLLDQAFSTAGASGQTSRDILESSSIPKVFFDITTQTPSLAISASIHLAGLHDLQLMELATRHFSRKQRTKCFNQRPLLPAIVRYCQQDVQFMPQLWLHYKAKLSPAWERKVEKATRDRVALSQTETFIGTGKHMVLRPW